MVADDLHRDPSADRRPPSVEQPGISLAARDVAYAYGSRVAVDGVDVSVAAGEFVGVIGPNGSGKSTLLRLLSGFFPPRRGVVELDGRPLGEIPRRELARRISVVTQEYAVDFPFSVAEVVLMGRAPHLGGALFESARDVEIARRALARTRALDLAHRSIDELSGGERQRVVLARALAQEAPILLLDEPTAFLDIRHQVEVFGLLRDLRVEGYAIVAAVHDLNLAAGYCDRLVLLKDGRRLISGPPGDVLTAEHIRAAYEIEVEVRRSAAARLTVTPLQR